MYSSFHQHQRPKFRVSAIDISEKALTVAKKNATTHLASIDFKNIDILNNNNWSQLDSYDCIISNPPYIAWSENEVMAKQVVAFEPHEALFVPDNNPLLFYTTIAQFAKSHLANNGLLNGFLQTCAMPLPIVPAPIIETCSIKIY